MRGGVDQSEKKREASEEKGRGGGGAGIRDVGEWGREELRERCERGEFVYWLLDLNVPAAAHTVTTG